jgi:hypothetical protein
VSIKKHFQTLELNQGASKEDIRNAYRRLAKKYHPDISRIKNAESRFIEVNLAYEILIDFKEGGSPTYSVNQNETHQKNTRYHNSKFTQSEMEEAWARQRKQERDSYEEYLNLPWYHLQRILPMAVGLFLLAIVGLVFMLGLLGVSLTAVDGNYILALFELLFVAMIGGMGVKIYNTLIINKR